MSFTRSFRPTLTMKVIFLLFFTYDFPFFCERPLVLFIFFIMRRDLFVFNTTMIYSQKIKVSKYTIVMK